MSIRKRNGRYQVRVRIGTGERIERTLPPGARLIDAQALETAIRQRKIDTAAGRQPVRLIDEAIRQWEPQAKALKSWQKDLRYRVDVLRDKTAGKTLDELPEVAEQVRTEGLASGLTPAAINRYLAILRRLGNLAERWGWTDRPLGKRIQMLPGEKSRHVYLTPAEVRALMTACRDDEARDLILFASLTGLRRGEILSLTPANIVGHDVILGSVNKANKPRIVPMPPQARRIAAQRVPFGIGISLLNKVFREAREASGMPHVRLHDLRHTFASWLAADGVSMTAIRDLLGHSSLSVTSRYAHISRPDLTAATKRLRV